MPGHYVPPAPGLLKRAGGEHGESRQKGMWRSDDRGSLVVEGESHF